MNVPKALAAGGLFCAALAASLPDGAPGSPRAIVTAAGVGLLAAAVYLGAAKPEGVSRESGS